MKMSADLFKKVFPFVVFVILFAVLFGWKFLPKTESAIQPQVSESPINYDLRTDDSASAKTAIATFIEQSSQSETAIQTAKRQTIHAEKELRSKIPNLKIEYDESLQIPEVIAPEITSKVELLTDASGDKRADILKNFVRQNSELFGVDEAQIAQLKLTADYTNPNGILSFVSFEQKIGDVPVFRGEVKAGFTKRGEIIRVINNLAPNLNYETVSKEFGNAEIAVTNAAKHLDLQTNESDTKRISGESNDLKVTFERGQFTDETTAEKIYFPIDSGVVRTAWRVLLWIKSEAFYVIVDAQDGTLLWRKNLTEHQTQTATYNVYGSATSLLKTADSPSPFTPGCLTPNPCLQPPIIPRTDFTLIGNEPPYTFNNTGWITDGENRTIGNNIEAGIDRVAPNGIDDNGWAFGSPNRVFNYAYNPAPGNPAPGESPLPTTQTYPPSAFQQGSITHVFYTANRWHDETYRLGFTESARNFQTDNFGRGGIGNDSISVETQDVSGSNSANFSTAADGARGRAQFFIWTNTTPNRDGALDSQVVVHELTHGLSNRLHGNANGLNSNLARGMGEGWSDFYALSLLSETADARLGTHTIGGYLTNQITPGFEANYYYGIRRFPIAVWDLTGANNCRHNPLTFADIDSTQFNIDNGCFPRGPIGSTTADQVHNLGEVWSSILWEVRDKLIQRHGAAEGNRRVLQYVTDGMKLAPLNPTFLQERDAILTAAQISDAGDISPVWAGFAVRGLGFTASIQNVGTGANNTRVTESFSAPNVVLTNPFAVSDALGNNNGYPEPNDVITITTSLVNNTGATVTGVSVNVNGSSPTSFGNIANGQTVTRQINFQIPFNAPCPGNYTLTFNISSSAGTTSENRTIFLGVPFGGPPVSFTNSTAIDIPVAGVANPYSSAINVSGLTGTKKIRVTFNDFRHGWISDLDMLLVGPGGQKFTLMSDIGNTTAVPTVIDFSIVDSAANLLPNSTTLTDGAEYRPSNISAGDVFPAPAPASPYQEAAPAGTATLTSVFGTNGANLNGAWNLYILDDVSPDGGRIEGGWTLTFETNDYFCTACRLCTPLLNKRADFDGDSKSDISVFRPSDGNWYLNRSTTGFSAVNWGNSTDTLVPGDYDGDGKADTAVFRNGVWYILKSSNATLQSINWGTASDIPVAGDFDGDGRVDATVFRPSNGTWYSLNSLNGQFTAIAFGQSGDAPINGDFDGDGKNDLVVYRAGTWYMLRSAAGFTAVSFGLLSDDPVPADYDGDNKDDIAVFRFTEGVWYRLNSSNGQFAAVSFGQDGDIPVPADYDGDGKDDQAVYRNGIWYLNRSTTGFSAVNFGTPDDKPIPKYYIP